MEQIFHNIRNRQILLSDKSNIISRASLRLKPFTLDFARFVTESLKEYIATYMDCFEFCILTHMSENIHVALFSKQSQLI